MSLCLITFDLDNTLWDVEPALKRAEAAQNAWLKEHRPAALDGRRMEELHDLRKRLWSEHRRLAHSVTAMRKLFLRELQVTAGYAQDEAETGAEEAFGVFLVERQRVDLYAGALEVLEVLARDYRLAALTNGNADVYRTPAGRHFDFALRADEVGASKPAADMFQAALERTSTNPHEALHVGDSADHDVRGALAVGMRAAWVNATDEPWVGEDRPHATVRHIRELPAAITALDRD